jgi:hypothetical protein
MELPTTISKYPSTTKDFFQLEDLLAFYPPSDKPKIQTLFTAKQEFNELASPPNEAPPKRGEYYNHQKLIQRFMRAIDKLLILHEAGTGKTCTMISVGEFYEMISQTLEGMTNSLLRQSFPIRKTYVLIRNPLLKDEFYNQLVCVCSKTNKYLSAKWIQEAKDEKSRAIRVRKEVGKWYKVMGYRDFANKIFTVKEEFDAKGKKITTFVPKISEEKLKKKFSNCLFFADEIHNLRNVEGDFAEMAEEDRESNIMNYTALWEVFHTAQNIKVMLATATPMINRPADLVPILNLLLPETKQVADNTDFAKMSLKNFEKIVRGLVSFVRVLDTGIDVVYKGDPIEGATLEVAGEEVEATTVLQASTMSDFQSRGYLDAELKEETDVRASGIRKPARHASNFVFPRKITTVEGELTFDEDQIGLYGTEGFKEYTEEVKKGVYRFKKNFQELVKRKLVQVEEEVEEDGRVETIVTEKNLSLLPTFSQKFEDIIQLCEENDGSCFCYTDDFALASGAVLLGLCFEIYGFKRFNTDSSAFEILGSKTTGAGSGFCAKDAENVKRRIRVEPAKRYAILSSDVEQETIRNILTLFNSKENMNGEYIKVIIASRKAREGLNLANVQNVHLVNPSWNQANMYQAIFRAIRATSHVDLLAAKRQKAIEEGKDPKKERITIRVYQHCSVISDAEDVLALARKLGDENISVELQMYQLSEKKDRNNAVVMRMLKQCALDCQIHKPRNQRDTDKNGSPVCNYTTCAYDCVDPPPKEIDFTTYDVYYKDELVEKIKKQLIILFEKKNTYTSTEILDAIQEFPAKFVIQGLSEMIKDKSTFTNRYGYTSFLSENGNKFFLVNELNTYSTESVEDLYQIGYNTVGQTEYNENLYAVGKKDFNETTRTLRKPMDELKANQILTSENLLRDIEKLDNNILITIIEDLLVKQFKQLALTDQQKKVLQKYRNLIFATNEPISLLEETIESRAEPSVPKRGRKKKTDGTSKIKKLKDEINIDDIEFGEEQIIVHVLNLMKVDSASFKTTSKFKKGDTIIRILKESEGQWRDTTDIERVAYNKLIQASIMNDIQTRFGTAPIYGTILQDNKFRIINKYKEDPRADENAHHKITGRECVNGFTFQGLTDLLQSLELEPEDFELEPNPNASGKKEEEMKKFLVTSNKYDTSNMTLDELKYAVKWASVPGIVKGDLCEIIQKYLYENNLLYKLVN